MAVVSLRVNGATHEVDVDTSTPLLYVLRNDLNLRGPRFGCGLAQCGACTVIIDGVAMRSCILPLSAVTGEVRCSRRGSTSRYRSAVTARTARS
jgi:aerobic-type carbon monoxide dehydrogenase small subunit (CoxS/CutS family)